MFAVAHRKFFLIFTALILAASGLVLLSFGLKLGIDFTGGALTEVAYDTIPDKSSLETSLGGLDLGGFSLRESVDDSGRDGYILRTRDLTEEERVQVEEVLLNAGPGSEITRFTSIGPVIGEELKAKAKWAVAGVVLIIVLYVAFAFRGVGYPVSSWAYGGITILALIHDVLIPSAVMSFLGYWLGYEVDVLFVMALLAVLGYSVNDTIVVFDRVRENLVKFRQEKKVSKRNERGEKEERIEYIMQKPFAEVVGQSVSETIVRSINTSLTTLLALLALYFLGGAVTQTFALVLVVGVIAGTYSSIFLANTLLVFVAERQQAKEAG